MRRLAEQADKTRRHRALTDRLFS